MPNISEICQNFYLGGFLVSDLVYQGFLCKKDGLSIHRERYLQFFGEEQFDAGGEWEGKKGRGAVSG